jgi:thymidylate synthase (FAD)
LFSFSQRSQRCCNEDGFGYVIPDTIKEKLKTKSVENPLVDSVSVTYESVFKNFMQKAKDLYNEMVAAGVPKEDARYILPNACHTEIFVSGNFREWRHFLELRLSPRAQWEIRQLAHLVLNELYKVAPIIFQDLKDKYNGTEAAE